MKKIFAIATAITFVAGTNFALAEGSPDLNRPLGRAAPAPALAVGGPVMSDADARARLQGDGYRAIDRLTRGSDGAWRATAIRGAAKVNVTIDPHGRISAQ